MIDKEATQALMKSRAINMKQWCRNRNISYCLIANFLTNGKRPMLTLRQMQVIEELRKDGLLVEEKQAA